MSKKQVKREYVAPRMSVSQFAMSAGLCMSGVIILSGKDGYISPESYVFDDEFVW